MARTASERGNDAKAPWLDGELKLVGAHFRSLIELHAHYFADLSVHVM
jgi:hypothetical protein